MAPAVASNDFRGKKRTADDELEGEQPLTKKLGRLFIGRPLHHGPDKPPQSNGDGASFSVNDAMHLDDTKDRVYIHDLDSELANLEFEDSKIAFLPEIEKKLMGVPKSVLEHEPPRNNELVLYQVPSSLSIPENRDSVRRAIIEARERARENTSQEDASFKDDHDRPAKTVTEAPGDSSNDADVMDVDDS